MTYIPSDAQRRFLYRCYDAAGSLLYVGVTGQPVEQRLRQHKARGKAWATEVARIVTEVYPNPGEGHVAENQAIRDEEPLHNIARPLGGGRPRRVER